MPARKKQGVTFHHSHPPNNTIGPRPHLPGGFAPRAAITEQAPSRPLSVNLNGPAALVLPIVPLKQIRFDLSNCPKTSQLARSRCALQRAGQDVDKFEPSEPLAKATGIALTTLGERQIRQSSMLA